MGDRNWILKLERSGISLLLLALVWSFSAVVGKAEPPGAVKISPNSRTFTAPIEISLGSDEPSDRIRFTTDGSVPSATNGSDYKEPIRLRETTQIRAVAIRNEEVGKGSGAHFVHLSKEVAAHKSNLPIMVISTFEKGAIPGKGWNQMGVGIKQVPRLPAGWMLFERDEKNQEASLSSEPQIACRIGIRQRGAFSSTWKEKPYSVEVWDEADDDHDVAPLGMPEESDWVLYYPDPTPKKDRTLIYNAFMWTLSRKAGRYAPRFRFVEAFVNEDGGSLELSDRRGIYALVEKVKRGEQRLPFEKLSDDGKTGGWILTINRMDSEPSKGWPAENGTTSPQFFHTAGPDRRLRSLPNELGRGDDFPALSKAQFNLESPSGYKIMPEQRAAIEGWLKEFEDVLYDDSRWLDPENGYRKYIDSADFADFLLFNNLAQNFDGLLLSVYPWKSSADGKLRMGPTWDFNWNCYDQSGSYANSVIYQGSVLWYGRLFQDPEFTQLYFDRWRALRSDSLSDASIKEVIAGLVEEIGGKNAVAQGISSEPEWTQRINVMQTWLLSRADWLDQHYPTTPMFSVEPGAVKRGTKLTLSSRSGVVYFTTDGTDPRARSGQPSARAKAISPFKQVPLLKQRAKASAIVPNNGALGNSWTKLDFNDRLWQSGSTGIGYDEDPTYKRIIGLDLEQGMAGKRTSAFIRVPFEIDQDPADFVSLKLNMAYDDGFIAYLNGTEIESQNAPEKPIWSSASMFKGSDAVALRATPFDVGESISTLRKGKNVLAIHGLNANPTSSDFFIQPELTAGIPDDSGVITIDGELEIVARSFESGMWSRPVHNRYQVK
jgi:hypothetical protein